MAFWGNGKLDKLGEVNPWSETVWGLPVRSFGLIRFPLLAFVSLASDGSEPL